MYYAMSIGEFIKGKMVIILCNVLMFIIAAAVMFVINININIIVIVFCIWFLPLVSYMVLEFVRYKKHYGNIEGMLEKLDERTEENSAKAQEWVCICVKNFV